MSVVIILDLSKPEELWNTLDVFLTEVSDHGQLPPAAMVITQSVH